MREWRRRPNEKELRSSPYSHSFGSNSTFQCGRHALAQVYMLVRDDDDDAGQTLSSSSSSSTDGRTDGVQQRRLDEASAVGLSAE